MFSALNHFRQRIHGKLAKIRRNLREFHCDKEYFVHHDLLSAIGGLHLMGDDGETPVWWSIYRGFTALMYVLMTWRAYQTVTTCHELVQLVYNMLVYTETIVVLVRLVLIGSNYTHLGKVREYINARNFDRQGPCTLETRKRSYFVVRNVSLVSLINLMMVAVPALVFDIDALRLPFQVSNHTLLNTVIQKIYIVLIFSATVNAVNNFVTIFMVLKGLLTEAEVVANSFNRIFDQASVIPLTQEASSSNSDESTFWDQLNQQFAEHINQHCILLGHIQTIRPLLEGTFLVIYYVTAFNIACGCFFVMAQDKPFNIYTIQVVNLIILQTFECFVYTYLTTKLKDVHSSIGQAVYCLSWPQNLKFSERFGPQYRAVRAKLTLIQERCNQDVRFSTGGHFEFTQERFTELMNMTYTLVTFLWEMKKGG